MIWRPPSYLDWPEKLAGRTFESDLLKIVSDSQATGILAGLSLAQAMLNHSPSECLAMKFLKKILLVDHEPSITALVRRALENTGRYLVRVEQDSRLALHAAPWFLPDLVMLDAQRAESECEEVHRSLTSEPALKDTPFLFLGGAADSGKKMLTGGFISGYSFLATSVSLDDLIRCVDEMLNPARPSTSEK